MTVLCIDGLDMYNGVGANTGIGAKWTTSGTVTLVAGRFSGQALSWSPGGAATMAVRNLSASSGTVSACFALRCPTMPSNATLGSTMVLESSGTTQVGFRVTQSGAIEAYRFSSTFAGTSLGISANGVIVVNTWHFVEFSTTISATVGTVTVKVDGIAVLTLTGLNTKNATTTVVDSIRFGAAGAGNNGTFNVDDLYVIDSITSLGERRVETLRPAADSTKVWTPNSGVTNFSRVNETLVDGDTSYVQSSNVGDRDLYTIGALSSSPTTIDAIQLSSFGEKTDATTRTIFNSCQSAGTDSDGSAFGLAASYSKFERIMATDPNGGGAWTAARVNGLLIGPKIAS